MPPDYKNPDGTIGVGQPLTDIQQYNMSLDFNTRWVKRLVISITVLGSLALLYLFYMTYYLIHNSVVNNALNVLGRC